MYRERRVPQRIQRAWALGAQTQLIAAAEVVGESLIAQACAFHAVEVPSARIPALHSLSIDGCRRFAIAPDGGGPHWPDADVHLDLEALRAAVDPALAERARALRLAHNVRFGAAVAALRQRHALGQAQVSGLSERQVRRIEQGARPRPATQGALAESHGLSPAAHLDALAAEMGPR